MYELIEDNELQGSKQFAIKGISRALLFDVINKKLREKYLESIDAVLAVIFIYINAEQNDRFLEGIVKV